MPGKHKANKNRENKSIQLQLMSIFYFSVISLVLLTSQTSAYFISTINVTSIISMDTWAMEEEVNQIVDWDESDLTFYKAEQYEEKCGEENLSVIIVNKGLNMKKPTKYEIYYSVLGTYEDGEKIGGGIIDPLMKDESVKLSHSSLESGNYYFEILRDVGNSGERELRSEIITIQCADDLENDNSVEQTDFEQKNPQSIELDKNEESESGEEKEVSEVSEKKEESRKKEEKNVDFEEEEESKKITNTEGE